MTTFQMIRESGIDAGNAVRVLGDVVPMSVVRPLKIMVEKTAVVLYVIDHLPAIIRSEPELAAEIVELMQADNLKDAMTALFGWLGRQSS